VHSCDNDNDYSGSIEGSFRQTDRQTDTHTHTPTRVQRTTILFDTCVQVMKLPFSEHLR
jgi:hypothetical protein